MSQGAGVVSSSATVTAGDAEIGRAAQRKASWRLLPVIAIGYALAFIDRINIGFASLRMNSDLHFSATIYGLGSGLFFIGYALCEVPSNLMMLRCGARRWLARIMMTWGVLATAMMLVRTPWQFYTVRLLLGIAEAGFFPGVVYYLTLWFPARVRARAISRFYIAAPLGSTVIGVLAGWLMGLNGRLGLTGWQWLFLVEGIPPILFGFIILRVLPDGPTAASWLTSDEKSWLAVELARDGAKAHLGHEAGVLRALRSPKVWIIGLYFFCALTCNYAWQFSGPAILQGVTGWTVGQVGMLTAAMGVAGAAGMLGAAISSDRTGDRGLHCIVLCCAMGVGFLVASLAHPAWLVVAAIAVSFITFFAMLGPGVAVPTEFLAGRAAAAGIAAMNTITMFSGFVGPFWMGRMKDITGGYWLGLRGLIVPSLLAAALMAVLMRSLARQQRPAIPSDESAPGNMAVRLVSRP
ncbi:MAG TPA: MFS transporter [Acidobacteriaceae bacterium]|nr:MFS transporter [Acidobacteriaceae bacterium]